VNDRVCGNAGHERLPDASPSALRSLGGEVRRTPAMGRRPLTLLRLKPWAAVREAAVAPSR
jgi:hypothetical protein